MSTTPCPKTRHLDGKKKMPVEFPKKRLLAPRRSKATKKRGQNVVSQHFRAKMHRKTEQKNHHFLQNQAGKVVLGPVYPGSGSVQNLRPAGPSPNTHHCPTPRQTTMKNEGQRCHTFPTASQARARTHARALFCPTGGFLRHETLPGTLRKCAHGGASSQFHPRA